MPPIDSVTVSPTDLSTTRGCAPAPVKAIKIDSGPTIAQACFANPLVPDGLCPEAGQLCTYPPLDGLSVCLFQGSYDVECPASWPQKHLFYLDTQACNCECGDASGDSCSTTVTVYEDGACATPLGSVAVTAEGAQCLDVTHGSTVGSVSATAPTYQAGSCAPKFTKNRPSTMCCLP